MQKPKKCTLARSGRCIEERRDDGEDCGDGWCADVCIDDDVTVCGKLASFLTMGWSMFRTTSFFRFEAKERNRYLSVDVLKRGETMVRIAVMDGVLMCAGSTM